MIARRVLDSTTKLFLGTTVLKCPSLFSANSPNSNLIEFEVNHSIFKRYKFPNSMK